MKVARTVRWGAVGKAFSSEKQLAGRLPYISYGEHSLYLTPPAIAQLMAQMTVDEPADDDDHDFMISDPCCGSGIPLIEAGKRNPKAALVGQDIDARCAMMTAVNLSLNDRQGWIICGNTLTREVDFVYRIGDFYHEGPNGLRRGMIHHVPPQECPILPELQQHTKRELFDTLESGSPSASERERTIPRIMEIPDALVRLERAMIQREQPEQQPAPSNVLVENTGAGKPDEKPSTPSSKDSDDGTKTQGSLF